jgi:hypothetical protein
MSENQDQRQFQEQLLSAFSGELNLADLQILSDQEAEMVAGGKCFINGTSRVYHHRQKHRFSPYHSREW